MRGHEPLIEMRMKGHVPDCAWIDTDKDNLEAWRYWLEMNNASANIQIEPTDKHPDLRCIVGLPCYIQGSDRKLVAAIRDACIAAGASRVVAMFMERFGQGEFVAFRVLEVTDTSGLLTYTRPTAEAA